MSGSVSFDRAANIYDKTRALPEKTMDQLITNLATELSARAPVLEIGVGTGRLALPLAAKGIDITGIDLSSDMLDRLQDKGSLRLTMADATRLPFSSNSFGAALACHVFHLIPNWNDAVIELARVVRGGGVILVELGGRFESPFTEISDELARRGGLTRRHVGLDIFNLEDAVEMLDTAFVHEGAARRDLEPIPLTSSLTYESIFRDFEKGWYSWTWPINEERRVELAREVRPWARERFGSLDTRISVQHQITWAAYDLRRSTTSSAAR